MTILKRKVLNHNSDSGFINRKRRLRNQLKSPSQHNLLFPRGSGQLELIVTIDSQALIAKHWCLVPEVCKACGAALKQDGQTVQLGIEEDIPFNLVKIQCFLQKFETWKKLFHPSGFYWYHLPTRHLPQICWFQFFGFLKNSPHGISYYNRSSKDTKNS